MRDDLVRGTIELSSTGIVKTRQRPQPQTPDPEALTAKSTLSLVARLAPHVLYFARAMALIDNPSKSKLQPLLPWTEPELGTVDDFESQNHLYPACIVTIYQIIRDLHIKQEVIEISVVDGSKWSKSEYFIQARTRASDTLRLMIPFYLDAEIDLPW